MAHPAFQLKRAKNDQFYFTLTAKNGQVISQSLMYESKDAALNGIASVEINAPKAEIDDQTMPDDYGHKAEHYDRFTLKKSNEEETKEQTIDRLRAENRFLKNKCARLSERLGEKNDK